MIPTFENVLKVCLIMRGENTGAKICKAQNGRREGMGGKDSCTWPTVVPAHSASESAVHSDLIMEQPGGCVSLPCSCVVATGRLGLMRISYGV